MMSASRSYQVAIMTFLMLTKTQELLCMVLGTCASTEEAVWNSQVIANSVQPLIHLINAQADMIVCGEAESEAQALDILDSIQD